MKAIFDSQNAYFKTPFGAVESGTPVTLKLVLEPTHYSPELILIRDEKGEERLPFEYKLTENGFNIWECRFTPQNAGLYFYRFDTVTDTGRAPLYKDKNSPCAVFEDTKALWQLTVYERTVYDRGCERYLGGVMYQIFPDRFCFSGEPKTNVPKDRTIRTRDEILPFYGEDNSEKPINTDYWQGDFKGIQKNLDYLSRLGVTIIYLNPIFEAHSNHRYNTADYEKSDPMLGTNEDFAELCNDAKRHGISVILDGVFSHTGADSKYFNLYGRYGEDNGAAKNRQSPYFGWYRFTHWPDAYGAWWNVPSLPEVNEENDSFLEYITGENGIAARWLRLGASGWRLDVADELPDVFLDRFFAAVKRERADAPIWGEVWEDASNKQSYSKRRRYLLGGQLDSVMNYPLRSGIISFLTGANAEELSRCVMQLAENYPPHSLNMLMNILSTHDTERILTALCVKNVRSLTRLEQASLHADEASLGKARRFLMLAAALLYTLPGIPCVYYGDETGCAFAGGDPFNRAPFKKELRDQNVFSFYETLGRLRRDNKALKDGELRIIHAHFGFFVYERVSDKNRVLTAVNRWCDAEKIAIEPNYEHCAVICGTPPENNTLTVAGEGVTILSAKEQGE